MSKSQPFNRTTQGVIDKALLLGGNDPEKLNLAFKAGELGIILGWRAISDEDAPMRAALKRSLTFSLSTYRTAYSKNDANSVDTTRESVRRYASRYVIDMDSDLLHEILHEFGGTLLLETAGGIWDDEGAYGFLDRHVSPGSREGVAEESARSERYGVAVIRDLALQRLKEGQSPLPPEGVSGFFEEEKVSVRRERANN